jgi:trehalose 6-phosphate phosphatase
MNAALIPVLDQALARHREGDDLVLLFDYDGTLVDFADDPSQARLSATTRQHLHDLASVAGVTVGVISGRELADLKAMVGVPGLYYAGTDGLELEFQGKVINHPLVGHCLDLVSRVADILRPFVGTCPPAWVEQKRFGLSVHYRGLDGQLATLLHEGLDQHLAPWAERLHVVTGGNVVEITPNIGWTNGTAVDFLLEHLDAEECHILYAGDEASDVEAMWTVGTRGGVAIGVGPGLPATAEYKLPSPAAVDELLDELSHALGAGARMSLAKNWQRHNA